MGLITYPMQCNTDDERDWAFEVNFSPRKIVATVAITHLIHDPGRAVVGIRKVRERQPDGSDKTINFGKHYWNWKKRFHGDNISSVTFGVSVYECNVGAIGLIHTF